ncbi:WbqC family protein [bacterium]|nr:WbqC family protein [bacterium]
MIVTAHQPEHLPWLGYFHKMALADCYVFMDTSQYRHRYFQNRNQILGIREAQWLTVPVRKQCSRYGPLLEVAIDDETPWQHKYWKSIAYHYARHPYFAHYAEALERILMAPHTKLVELNYALIDFFRTALGITTPLLRASALGATGFKTDLIHDICLKAKASVYLSGPSGRDYLQEAPLRQSGIGVCYHDFKHPSYPQHGKKQFTPQLSTLDLLMNCGPQSREVLGLDALQDIRRSLVEAAASPLATLR